LSNPSPPLLQRAINTYRRLAATGRGTERPARAPAKRGIRLNDAQIARLSERYQAGKSVYELADAFQVSRGTASGHLKTAGITLRLNPLTPEEVDLAVRLYRRPLDVSGRQPPGPQYEPGLPHAQAIRRPRP